MSHHTSAFFNFSEMLKGLRIEHRKTGKEFFKYELFDQQNWFAIASQIKSGIHPTYIATPKNGVSKRFAENINSEQNNY